VPPSSAFDAELAEDEAEDLEQADIDQAMAGDRTLVSLEYSLAGLTVDDELNAEYEDEQAAKEAKAELRHKMSQPDGVARLDNDLNDHFRSALAQAWPHSDIYEPARMELEGTVMTQEQEANYIRDYGGNANLYLNASRPRLQATGMRNQFGTPRVVGGQNILDTKLNHNSDVHRKNMLRIVYIYCMRGRFGVCNGHSYTQEEKRARMLNGIYVVNQTKDVAKKGAGAPQVADTAGRGRLRLWGPVFTDTAPTKRALQKLCPIIHECIENALDTEIVPTDTILHCARDALGPRRLKLTLNSIDTDMTVREWVTTPWHYQTLPYQTQDAVFVNGETYSSG